MAIIDKKLIHFKKWNTFISSEGVNGNYTTPSTSATSTSPALYGQIKETSIVFIQDVQKIWTHGKLYDCSTPDLSTYLTAEDLAPFVKYNDYLMPNNVFYNKHTQFGISYLNNALYAADKRFNVNLTGFNSNTSNVLFDGNYETSRIINAGGTGKVTISNNGNGIIDGYPYGFIYVTFYYDYVPESISMRAYCNYEPHGIGWHDLPLKEVSGDQQGVFCFKNSLFNVSDIEINIKAKSNTACYLSQIDWCLNRAQLLNYPAVTKFAIPQTMYGDYTFAGTVKLGNNTNIKTVNSNSLLGSGNISVGTITKVQANGTDVSSSGTANIPAASTSAYGVTKLSSSTSSTSTSLAATASAVKSAYDLANGKQDKLTSGTNIKTINGQSVLGSGNITISAFANQGYTTDIIEPGLYKVIQESYINLGSITSHPNSIYTIYIKPISDPLEINYPTNFKWCNGEPNFASIGDDGKVVELNILVLDDGSSSHLNTCLCTWAVFE